MEYFKNSNGKCIVNDMIQTIQSNRDYLSSVDGAIGDGDHGVNMNKGFTITKSRIEKESMSFSQALNTLGETLLTEIGGSMGPIYGTLFMEMGDAIGDREKIDAVVFLKMLKNACAGLCSLVDARIGDKTLMDVLIPASDCFGEAVSNGKTFVQALDDMSGAAARGRDSTKDLKAKFGRASRLGARSIGVLDAGAVSCELLFFSMAKSAKKLMMQEAG